MEPTQEAGGLSATSRRELATLFGAGKRTVSVDEAAIALDTSRVKAAKRLAALASRGWLRRIRRGLYLAVPADAAMPSMWTEDAWYLADLVWKPCYIGGWSAANHWSLTDQVFRSTVVMTANRVRRVSQELAGVAYLVHHVPPASLEWGLAAEWRHERRVQLSNPERTVADLLTRPELGGGIRHTMEILDTAMLDASVTDIVDAVKRLKHGAALKRLGYLLEELGYSADAIDLPMSSGVVLLDPALPNGGPRSPKWGLRVNVDLSA